MELSKGCIRELYAYRGVRLPKGCKVRLAYDARNDIYNCKATHPMSSKAAFLRVRGDFARTCDALYYRWQ